MKTELSTTELQKHFEEQLDFLLCSASSYDNGFEGEIKRLAVSIRVLVHDTSRSTSLLTLLGEKNINFVDTSLPYNENNKLSHSGLVQLSIGSKSTKPLPVLDESLDSRKINFEPWWNGVVLVDTHKNEFSRKDIVLALANKEGGAHVDTKLDRKYSELRKNNALGWYDVSIDGTKKPSADQVPATMRQIAHEALKTLKPDYTCVREKNSDDGIFIMGMSVVQGSNAPPIPKHNLPKNRPTIGGTKIGRNSPCPCGSGKKYKKCCIK